jgi:hypothetical protein
MSEVKTPARTGDQVQPKNAVDARVADVRVAIIASLRFAETTRPPQGGSMAAVTAAANTPTGVR